MNLYKLTKGSTWKELKKPITSEQDKILLKSKEDADKELKKLALERAKAFTFEEVSVEKFAQLHDIYEAAKPVIAGEDVFDLLSVDINEEEKEVDGVMELKHFGVINYKLNGEHLQHRF